ncbi:Uncharacterised protein [Mycobacteroides abscessus subsp. abscessus]|nr:Uncharacterised protein [Mycobacteroides abscessus subsp. abscessus]
MTPRRPGRVATAARSSSQNSDSILLMRTHADIPDSSARTTLSRASSFLSSATEASRSKITESASEACAGAKSSSFAALTSSHERESLAGREAARRLRIVSVKDRLSLGTRWFCQFHLRALQGGIVAVCEDWDVKLSTSAVWRG